MGNFVSDSSLNLSDVERCVVLVKDKRVIIDHDVAALYNVETKRVNEAVKNNPEKFPAGYVIELTSEDVVCLRSKNSTLNRQGRGKHSKYLPKAFTEKGLYMLATILKSPVAARTTISIIETFARIKDLSNTLKTLSETEDRHSQQELARQSGDMISQIITENCQVNGTETTIEVNLAMLKFKHTIKRKKG